MLKKFFRDITRNRQIYDLCTEISPVLKEYYFIFEENRLSKGKDQALIHRFDSDGIPINRTYIDVRDKDYVYFPISIGQVGLSVFHTLIKTESDNDRKRFLKFCEWFCHNGQPNTELGMRWLTEVALPQYRNPEPWQSAFAQSRGISVLLRGYQLTSNAEYAEAAEKALLAFTFPVSKGGVTAFTEWGPFYEEYTASVPTLVLNGMIFSLFGLCDFCRVFPDHELAQRLYQEGLDTLEKILPHFDLNYWSRYNLCRAEWYPRIDPATVSYQNLHVLQLRVLYELTGRAVFKSFADRFSDQVTSINAIRSFFVKYKALKKLNRI